MGMKKSTEALMMVLFMSLLTSLLLTHPSSAEQTFRINSSNVIFSSVRMLLFIGAALTMILMVSIHLEESGGYAHVFYLLSISAIAMWILNAGVPNMNPLLNLLSGILHKFGSEKTIPIETAFYIYVFILLLFITAVFYATPRRSRELGFLTFGMIFSMPFFRGIMYPPKPELIGLTAFMLSVAMATSLVFSPRFITGVLQTLILSTFTLLSILMEPWSAVLPIAFVLTFPRKRRNAAYVTFVLIGTLLASGNGLMYHPNAPGLTPRKVLLQSMLPLSLLVYAVIFKAPAIITILRNSKGPTPFLILLLATFAAGSVFSQSLVPYTLATLIVLSVRLVFHTRDGRRILKKGPFRA